MMADPVVTDKQTGQKSKVIFADEREIFERGHEEIGADILQKAFDDASGCSEDPLTLSEKSCYDSIEVSDANSGNDKDGDGEPFLAIYEGENGQTRTVRLTAEQAEAMGIHFSTDADSNRDASQLEFSEQLEIEQLPEGMTHIYSEVPESEDQVLFEDHDLPETMIFEESEIIHTTQENEEHLISSMGGFLNENGNQQLTLSIPQVINGKVTYTVIQPPGETNPNITVPATESKPDPLQLAPQPATLKRTPVTVAASTLKPSSGLSKVQPLISDQCSRTITVKQSLINNNKRQKYLIDTRPKVLTNVVTPKVIKPSDMTDVQLYDSVVSKTTAEEPPRAKASLFLSSKNTPPVATINVKPRDGSGIATPKPASNVQTGNFTHVMASDGQLVSGSSGEQSKQMSSELSAVLTKMMPRQINKAKPLGSSENPIQLVQHGQTFHSVQSLNQEQLKQIATVLQRQHLESPPRAAKSVLYNAETNTRIIYRVVYPEDLKQPGPVGKGKRGRPRKPDEAEEPAEEQKAKRPRGRPRKGDVRSKSPVVGQTGDVHVKEEMDEGDDAQERKRAVARTRSGRVSRPPRHMVKDYKRLHRLDPSEPDVDDSDGGYSDYQTAEPDKLAAAAAAAGVHHEAATYADQTLLSGLPTVKRNISSSNRCPTCQKIYLGASRMAHHFDAFPEHRVAAPDTAPAPDEAEAANGGGVREKTQVKKKKRGGPWTHLSASARSDRRKLKLRELLATLEPGELAEVAGPALADALSLWELLLLRVHAARARHGHAAAFCAEIAAALARARAVAARALRPAPVGRERRGDDIQLEDSYLCAALGLPPGWYRADDGPLRPPPSPPAAADGPPCPELLSALTLVAKKSSAPVDTVDALVNERLENLDGVGGDGLCTFAPASADPVGLIDTLDHFQSNESKSVWEKEKVGGREGSAAGAAFDPADALMGDEGVELARSYEREMSLGADGGGGKRAGAAAAERAFPVLGLADVSLDESGPELDFEALSEEFNRNTRHSS